MQDYTRLRVWQLARSLTVQIHESARDLARDGAPGLRAQLLRAAMSISSNIAEGAGRETRRDFARFVNIAAASASEVQHHLTVAGDLGLLDRIIAERLIDRTVELRRMLFGLRRALLEAAEGERVN